MPEWLKDWWPAIALLLTTTVLPFILWSLRTGLASRRDLDAGLAGEAKTRAEALAEIEERVGKGLQDLDRRTLRIEAEIRHLPTAEDFSGLKTAISRVEERGIGMERELQGVSRAMTRVEDHLLKGA